MAESAARGRAAESGAGSAPPCPPHRHGTEKITLAGHVQGVGFRPFVYRLAVEHGLTGYVQNRVGEVEVVVAGPPGAIGRFREDLLRRAPPLSKPRITGAEALDSRAFDTFEVIASAADSEARIFVPPDYFMCDDCRGELHDPADRRYAYPFINCTQCGPRYTLIRNMPYDRPNTSMAGFPLCAACAAEYRDPADRRFHAEPVACPDCGPRLTLESPGAADGAQDRAALAAALDHLRAGRIVAVKGVGGYHLMCDAVNPAAVARLRERKRRPDKPLAVMFPLAGADGLEDLRRDATPTGDEAELLAGPERPIVLVRRRARSRIAENVAPGLAELGAFLPYSPLHELLLAAFGGPLVATSGNISGEPVLTDNVEAARRLADVADAFLQHDRPIVRPADDPVWRRIAGRPRPLRIGRGSAPRELELPFGQPEPVLAVGGHMKGTVALSWGDRAVVSPHIGEMDSPRSLAVFEQVAEDLQALYGVRAERLVCDAHPGYTTHRWARTQELPVETVWHHRAHASALVGEVAGRAGDGDPWLVFAWDGVGYGEDGTLWGGEALFGAPGSWRRVGSLKSFRLPGGERAGREPWRSAAAITWECGADWADCPDPEGLARAAWERDLNCPRTSAAGRLFDAAAALIGGWTHTSFEAQGPMMLESLCRSPGRTVPLPVERNADGIWRIDWQPLLPLLADAGQGAAARAEGFHSSMARALVEQARAIRAELGDCRVGLAGGVFQNRVLTRQVVDLLEADGNRVIMASVLPCNDAALSFGQAVEAAARRRYDADAPG